MDNKKIVSVAVLAVLALAFAGYGYADYTASTYNEGNEVIVNYLVVEPEDWTAIADLSEEPIEINTYTYGTDSTLYKLVSGDEDIEEDTPAYIQVGEDYVLTITDSTTEDFDSFKIQIDVLGQINTGEGFNLYLKVNNEDPVALTTSMDPIEVAAAETGDETEVTLGLYILVNYDEKISFPTTQGWTDILGSTEKPAVDPLLTGPENGDADHPGATFIFTVTGVMDEP
jgi:hypothetical protein